MATNNEIIDKTFLSRIFLLQMLKMVGYDTSLYEGFDKNNIYILLETNQLDMMLYKANEDPKDDTPPTHDTQKIFVKYGVYTTKINCDQNFQTKISEHFEIPDDTNKPYLNKKDTLMMVVDTEITEKIQERLKSIYENAGQFVVIHNMARLRYNLLTHATQPDSFHILNDTEVEEFKTKHYIDNMNKIPEISRFDPYALAICLRPGQICKVERTSVNGIKNEHWAYCV